MSFGIKTPLGRYLFHPTVNEIYSRATPSVLDEAAKFIRRSLWQI